MAVLKAIVSLYCAGEEKPIERCTVRPGLKSRKRINYFVVPKKDIIEFNWSQQDARKMVSQAIQTCQLKPYDSYRIVAIYKQTNTYN